MAKDDKFLNLKISDILKELGKNDNTFYLATDDHEDPEVVVIVARGYGCEVVNDLMSKIMEDHDLKYRGPMEGGD